MRYIEQIDNEIREYEIEIDDLELYKKIINDLEKKCSNIVKRNTKVTGNTRNEAISKINQVNTSGIKIVGETHNSKIELDGLEGQNMYEVEYFARQDTFLAHILKTILSNYETNTDLSDTINILLDYENSDEFKDLTKVQIDEVTPELFTKYFVLKDSYLAALECLKKRLIKTTINFTDGKVYKIGER